LNEPDPGSWSEYEGGSQPNASYGKLENSILLILLFSTSFPEPVYLFVSQLKTSSDLKLGPPSTVPRVEVSEKTNSVNLRHPCED